MKGFFSYDTEKAPGRLKRCCR